MKLLMTKLHQISKLVQYFPNRAICCQTAGLLVAPRVSKSRMRGRAISYQAPHLCNQLPVYDGSGDPGTSHCYAAPCSPCIYYIIVFINLWFSFSADIPGLVFGLFSSPLSCPLNPQHVEADGQPPLVWFCQRFLPVKREFFRLMHAQDGRLHRREVLMQSVCFLSWTSSFWPEFVWIGLI